MLKGANGDELKKVKHVVHYGVFAAYHLALETSFLADEGASLPELPLKSPIKVALPDKPSSIDRSISTIPGFTTSTIEQPRCQSNDPNATQNAKNLVSSVPSLFNRSNNFPEQGGLSGYHVQDENGKDGVRQNESFSTEVSGHCNNEVGNDNFTNTSFK